MGQKVNPIAFRTGVMIGWKSRWYASKQEFAELLVEDQKIRNFIKNHPKKTQYRNAGIDRIEIERTRDEVKVVLHVARPGLIIGKGECFFFLRVLRHDAILVGVIFCGNIELTQGYTGKALNG